MALRGRDYRLKASDLLNRGTPVFGKLVPFAEAYPQITEMLIEVSEHDYSTVRGTHRFSVERPPGEFVDCTNPVCYGGGFSIGGVIHRMVLGHLTEDSGGALCKGYEGSPKGRKRRRDCMHSFEYKVSLKYKEPGSTD